MQVKKEVDADDQGHDDENFVDTTLRISGVSTKSALNIYQTLPLLLLRRLMVYYDY
jgi:hypothetical protein